MPIPVRDICNGQAGLFCNVLCFPCVCTMGLSCRSFRIFCVPCCQVLLLRCAYIVWRFFCCCCGWPYRDNTFYGASALGDFSRWDPQMPTGEEMNHETDWVRAQDLDAFRGKRPQLFQGRIEPADLCQGAVGDCWLVAAFACASEYPDFVRDMFVTREYNRRGLYKVRIYNPQEKKWVFVVVDDRIPCEKGTRVPRFMNPNGNELWAIILEKAYAKYCGSYANLTSGKVSWGWHAMTGDNCFQMVRKDDTSKKKDNWVREDIVILRDDPEDDKRQCTFRVTSEKFTINNIWTLLKKYDRQQALISASIGKDVDFRSQNSRGELMLDQQGLMAGHAYSIIAVREIRRFRLLQIRNPWGTFEWKGDWSDKSSKWRDHPNVAEAVQFVDAEDGTFWMSFDDFIQVYTRINICDRTIRDDLAIRINENSGSCGIIWGWISGCFEYWCLCLSCRNLYWGYLSTLEETGEEEGSNECCSCCRGATKAKR